MKHTLALFDIDGTLIRPSYAHYLALEQAFRKVYSIGIKRNDISMSGKTDWQIVREMLAAHGRGPERIQECLAEMALAFAATEKPETLLAGARQALDMLKGRAVLGLLTGNAKRIAMLKMERVGLAGYFSTGAFGDEALLREDVARIAAKRAPPGTSTIYIIGDTPRDISAARAVQARAIAVTTGEFTAGQLAHADIVVASLEEIPDIILA